MGIYPIYLCIYPGPQAQQGFNKSENNVKKYIFITHFEEEVILDIQNEKKGFNKVTMRSINKIDTYFIEL